jgi:two-component system phosphate regulon sensor histidine kinase PhoR
MRFRDFCNQINIPAQCKTYGLPVWQCPPFLFLIMGLVIIVSSLIAYILGNNYIEDPFVVVLIVLTLSAILFVIAYIIIQGFEKLAEASRMKSEFINVVSHQLRSPLTNLKWTIDLLLSEEGVSSNEKVNYLSILQENSERMSELIDDLLIVSRLEAAKLLIKKEEFSLPELVQKVVQEFSMFAKASNVEIIFNPPENFPKILSDPHQLKIVIENFIDNAIRYIKEKGEIEIRISQKGNNILFEVEDNGVGIPKSEQKYIFQKFFRVENVLKEQTQGSGLGLYICKGIIKKLGGKIGFNSEEGKGSTFWFSLPIKS